MRPKLLSRIAIIKYKSQPLVETKSCASQVQVMTMAMEADATLDEMNTNFYNQLLSMNRFLFSPLIRVAKSAQDAVRTIYHIYIYIYIYTFIKQTNI